jgi:hypothetical protein
VPRSDPIVDEETVPNTLAVVGNWVAFVVAVLAVELGLMHHAHSLTTSLAAVVHWIYLGLVNFLVSGVGGEAWVGGGLVDWEPGGAALFIHDLVAQPQTQRNLADNAFLLCSCCCPCLPPPSWW